MYFRREVILFLIFLPNVLSFYNGLLKIFAQYSQAYAENESSIDDFVRIASENYFPLDNPQQCMCNDAVYSSWSKVNDVNYDAKGYAIHVPRESKSRRAFCFNNNHYSLRSNIDITYTHFPRNKHFNKELPKLPYEPYQRMMTFAIEVCMIPSIWYLELVHCLYVATAPFFKGMLMSYSLQDMVGSALKTMGYLDESFTIENCYKSIHDFTDSEISSNYDVICTRMDECLKSRQFSEEPHARLKEEFAKRIDNAYSKIDGPGEVEKHKIYARHSLLLSISSNKINKFLPDAASERNFLIVRAMILSLTYLANKVISTSADNITERFSKITWLINNMLFSTFDKYMKYCLKNYSGILGSNTMGNSDFLELVCKEFLAVGFIDESIEYNGEDASVFNNSIMPSRILDPAYIPVVPSYINVEEGHSDLSWLSFKSVSTSGLLVSLTASGKKRPKTNRYFKTAKATSVVQSQSGRSERPRVKDSGRLSKIFTSRRTRISKLISGNLN